MPFSDVIGHERPKAILQAALRHDRVAHAYLFHGDDGIGKRLTALRFAQTINCDLEWPAQGPDACGGCRSCRQIEACTHPDFLIIQAEQGQTVPQIKIEQVRELEHQIIYKPLIGRRKICLIDEADRLTPGAANALLKTLEEPPAYSLFLLVSSRPAALPATVRSRCQSLRFAAPARTQVEAALILKRELPPADARFLAMLTESKIGVALSTDLEAVRGQREELRVLVAPHALQSVTTLLSAAEALHKEQRANEALEWLGRWLRDLLLVRVGADADNVLNADQLTELQALARSLEPEAILDILSEIETIQRAASRNLNLQLALETILLRLRDAALPSPVSS
jgi:DNA polymerase-3 subunit delta'